MNANCRRKLRRRYGLSVEDYRQILAKQGGRCAVCKCLPEAMKRRLHVDHVEDEPGVIRIRGVLCARCNVAAGMVRNDITIVSALRKYLVKHRTVAI